MLDISRNPFHDSGFEHFAREIGDNNGLKFLDVSKNKDLSDEGSLVALAKSLSKNKMLRTLDLSGIRLRKPYLKSHLESALKTNIALIEVLGKISAGSSLERELGINSMIENKIVPCFFEHGNKASFDFDLVDPEHKSLLKIRNKPMSYIQPSFKFMNFHDMRAIDFSYTGFHDSHMCMLGEYLSVNPSLYSIVLDGNPFTDQSLSILASALKRNKTVAHLSILECREVTDAGI
jgi:hypothetical protein